VATLQQSAYPGSVSVSNREDDQSDEAMNTSAVDMRGSSCMPKTLCIIGLDDKHSSVGLTFISQKKVKLKKVFCRFIL
jgi:hypothetical protein